MRNDIGQRLGLSCFDIRLLLSHIVLLLLHRLGFLELLRLGKLGVLVLRSKISSRPSPPVTLLHFLGRWMHCNLLLPRITALPKPLVCTLL